MQEFEKEDKQVSPKRILTAMLLAIFLGALGAHNFYLGHIWKGILKIIMTLLWLPSFAIAWSYSFRFNEALFYLSLAMMITPLIWSFVELIIIVCGKAKDSKGFPVTEW